MHDLVIENPALVDGLGNPAVHGALAVKDGCIAELGADVGPGAETLDAEGLTLAPGIVDLHTHIDAQLTWDSYATPSNALGVTTVVIGNRGFTIAPCKAEHRDLILRNLTHVEGMSLDALRAGVDWDFESFPEYLDLLERKGMVPNAACFFGHSSLRTYVLGAEATSRAATEAEVAEMKRLVIEALAAGAAGFATSTLEQHNGENGIPMPLRLADEREMMELTGALGEAGRGVFMLTKGMTSTVPWLESISENNGRPVMIAAMFVDPGDPERVFRELGPDRGGARARPRALGPGRLLRARHGVHARASLYARGPDLLAPGDRGRRRRGLQARARRSFVPSGPQGRGRHQGRAQPLLRSELGPPDHRRGAQTRTPRLDRQEGRPAGAGGGGRSLGLVPRLRPRGRSQGAVRLQAVQRRRGPGGRAAAPPPCGDRAVGRRRPLVVPLRRPLWAALARPLGARARRHDHRGGGAGR